MDKNTFERKFEQVIKLSLDAARGSLVEEIPEEYLIILKFRDGRTTGFLKKEEAINKIMNGEMVPEWVNINFYALENGKSIVRCLLSDRYFENENELMYQEDGFAPFRVGYPNIPKFNKDGKKYSIKDLKRE